MDSYQLDYASIDLVCYVYGFLLHNLKHMFLNCRMGSLSSVGN
jgi:hypothetical protein